MASKAISVEIIKPYLTYAQNLKATEPLIALCCKTYYLQKFLEIKKQTGTPNTPEDKAMLNNLLQESEEEKTACGFNKEMAQEAVEEFCTRQFVDISKEEKTAPTITRNHAIQFKNTANFINLLSVYGELPPDWVEKSNS